MRADRWREIEKLFNELAGRPPNEQAAALQRVEPGVRREVEQLLASDGVANASAADAVRAAAAHVADLPKDPVDGFLQPSQLALAQGQSFGRYRILSLLGSGGMGEVYKAHDPLLNRPVAVKVLLQSLSARPDIRERFQREARAVANLNHPNICMLHDVGQQDGLDYLVMEYLEGETLARRLEKGRLRTADAIEFAIQITDALDKVHSQGIVHRDLKPQNVMLTRSGAKLLDFGLAKLSAKPPAEVIATTHAALTASGMILGTLHYMAPEQLQGEEVDERADIFSFGAIAYEMLAGRKAFDGNDAASVIAAILQREPEPIPTIAHGKWRNLEYVIRKCIAKNPDDRWQNAHDVLLQLRWIAQEHAETPPQAARARNSRFIGALVLCSVLAVISIISLAVVFRNSQGSFETYSEFPIHSPPNVPLLSPGFVSPDGRAVAFLSYDENGNRIIWLRSFESLEVLPLRGTEGTLPPLFWSPDSKQIGFFTPAQLKILALPAVPPQTLAEAHQIDNGASRGGAWSSKGTILFSPGGDQPLFRVPATGGRPVSATVLDEKEGEVAHVWPYFLPDGKHFIYSARNRNPQKTGLYAGMLDSTERKRIADGNLMAAYAAPGYLLFVRGQKLFAQKFDTARLELAGDPVVIASGLKAVGWYSVSQNGVLAVESDPELVKDELIWFGRKGERISSLGAPDTAQTPALSPDGREIVVGYQPKGTNEQNIWLLEAEHGRLAPFTFEGPWDDTPVWSPDGKFVAFTTESSRGWIIRRKPTDGAGKTEDLAMLNAQSYTADWSPDGRYIAFHTLDRESRWDCWLLPLTGDRKPLPLLKSPFDERQLQFSPDGHWIAYTSNVSGRDEVYVQRFPISKERPLQVSADGGAQPRWRRNGRELFYIDPGTRLMAVQIKSSPNFEAGPPIELFELTLNRGDGLNGVRHYDVSADGQRFLVKTVVGPQAAFIKIVLNWTAALKQQIR